MRTLTIRLLGILGILAVHLGAADLTTVDGRQRYVYDQILAYYKSHKNQVYTFQGASALFAQGRDAEAVISLPYLLTTLEPGNTINKQIYGGNSGFVAWPAIDCYRRFHERMTPELRERFRKIFTGAVWYQQLTTSNHKLMAATSRYLATEVWGEEAFVPDPAHPVDKARGSYFNAKDRNGLLYLRQIIESTITTGPGEYASRPYGHDNMLPLLSIAECSSDAALRNRARLAYEAGIVQLAPVWLKGHLATFSTRSYPDMLTQQPWGVASLIWVYFGGPAPDQPHKDGCVLAALSSYRPPAVLMAAGTDRSTAYRHQALMNGWALDHWTDRTFSIFSRSPKATNPKVLGQNYPTGVMWDEPNLARASQFWVTNPARDDDQTNGLHTHGVNAFEQQVLRRGTMLSVYDIPVAYRAPYLLGYAPGGYRAMVNDAASEGRIYLHYGSVLIAVTASTTFTWNPAGGVKWPATGVRSGDSEFRIPQYQTGLTTKVPLATAIETAAPDEYAGATAADQLAAFRTAVRSGTTLTLTVNGTGAPVGTLTDRRGGQMSLVYGGTDTVDGVAIDYKAWPVLASPWITQDKAGTRTITDGTTTVTSGLPKPDYVAPTVSITSPVEGAVLTGTTTLIIAAADNMAIADTTVMINGLDQEVATNAEGRPLLDTRSLSNGTHELRVVVTDEAGNQASAQVSVAVANAPASDDGGGSGGCGGGAGLVLAGSLLALVRRRQRRG